MLVIFLIFVFGFLVRLSVADPTNSDEWVSFWLIRRQKEHGWVNYEVNDSVISGIYGYPVLQHFIVSRFPEKWWGLAGRTLNASYDVIAAGCVYGVALVVEGQGGGENAIAGLGLAEAATLLFLTMPILFPTTARLKTIKARTLGLMLATVYFSFLGAGLVAGNWMYFGGAVVSGLLVILSSQFAVQATLFFSVLSSLWLWSPVPALVVGVTFLIGSVTPGLGTREVLRFMVDHKLWYVRNFQEGPASERNKIQHLLRLPIYLFSDMKRFVIVFFKEASPVIALYSAPISFLLFGYWGIGGEAWGVIEGSPAFQFMWSLVMASLIVFVLTSLRYFSFVGEAERYLQYSAPGAAILFVFLLDEASYGASDSIFWGVLLVHFIGIFANLVFARRSRIAESEPQKHAPLAEVIDWCDETLDEAVVATVPIKLSYTLSEELKTREKTGVEFYFRFIMREGERGFTYFEKDSGGWQRKLMGWTQSFDVFEALPSELEEEYGITHFVIKKNYVESLRRTWGEEAEILDRPLFENDWFVVCEPQRMREDIQGRSERSVAV